MGTYPRRAAYEAVLASLQNRAYAQQVLEEWRQQMSPISTDERFAREIAYGTLRMARALDYLAEQASAQKKLKLNLREKALLRTAIYQLAYMDRTAEYAVVNESVKLAKTLANPRFPAFLNAMLRNLSQSMPELPKGEDIPSLAIRYSYPDFFVEQLVNEHGIDVAKQVLSAGNSPSTLQARRRRTLTMEVINDRDSFNKYSKSPDYYIQDHTPAYLMETLSSKIEEPATILDLCAAPGGKLLAVHDHFPKATLYANEISAERMPRLAENIAKYGLNANVTLGPGEKYQSDRRFDLIILDVPCSNAGVLNKRPEARWRLTPEALTALNQTQLALIENASKLLSPRGSIFYLTCSLLQQENEHIIQEACKRHRLTSVHSLTILPTNGEHDGGFGCLCTIQPNLPLSH